MPIDFEDPHHHHSHTHGSDSDHSHSHHGIGHGHFHFGQGDAPKVIVQAILITIVFMCVELIGGWLSNSLALISDAAHMLTDVGAMLLSLFVFWIARKPVTRTMSFGYHRAEILGALASGLLIWLIVGVLIYEAITRLRSPPEVKGPIVFVVATIGLAANLLSMWVLNRARHQNLNVRAAYLHLMTDSLGSLGAIIAGAILWLTEWRPIDPIVTILFSGLMLYGSWSLVKEAVEVLMESTPTHVDPLEVGNDLQLIPGVKEAHDLHIWSVSSGRLALSVHLISEEAASTLLTTSNELLASKYGIKHTTIQIEHPDHFQSQRCYDCAPVED
jgi:cobalt-zinc-cadmium efflux system protein